jgi:enoyl-CoA hydratase/carnithine racemase
MLNSLNIEMCNEIKSLLHAWSSDPSVSSMLMRGEGEKAFCAGEQQTHHPLSLFLLSTPGGDVKSMYHALKERGPTIGVGQRGEPSADFFRDEYEMNYLLACSPVPQVSFWDGIVMGGGVGVSIFGKFRIATEKTLFAMPETGLTRGVALSHRVP